MCPKAPRRRSATHISPALFERGQIFAAGFLAMFGIFLQTVGLDAVTYTQRYTFGYSFLSSGVNLIVVVLGLFALSQAFFLLTAPDSSPDAKPVKGKISAGIKELMKHKRVATVASGFGVFLGMVPGTGEFTTQFNSKQLLWCSYTHTVKYAEGEKVMYAGASQFRSLLEATDARKNSAWREHVSGSEVIVKVHGIQPFNNQFNGVQI